MEKKPGIIGGSIAALALLALAGLYAYRSAVTSSEEHRANSRALASVEKLLLGGRAVTWEQTGLGEGDSARRVEIAGDAAELPGGCRPREVARLVNGYFDAYNAGDQKSLTTFFDWPHFQQYALGEKRQAGFFAAHNQDELLRYVSLRREQGERLNLLKIVTSMGEQAGTAALRYLALREGRDLPEVLIAFGNGVVNCETGKIIAWNEAGAVPAGEEGTQIP